MDARAKTVRDILRAGDQYLVPFFQRHYSWKLSNWQRLWDDLLALVKTIRRDQHFMGPLVCTPFESIPGEVPVYQLIDGQQRLTTLSVLLAAIRDLAREHGQTDLAEELHEDFLIQKRQKGLKRYKVIPRVGDRQVLFDVIDGNGGEQSRRDGIARAYKFFHAGIRDAIKDDPATMLRALVAAATSRLSLVVVTIDGENPYEIFDSLNSAGLPLEESDLIRNLIFMDVPLAEQQAFNDQYWQPFEEMFEEADDEPAVSPTLFYRDYLMREGHFVSKGSSFVEFKDAAKRRKLTSVELVTELRTYARFELMLRRPSTCEDPVLRNAMVRLSQQKMTTAYPLVLNLLARWSQGQLSQEDLLGCLVDLQSFVIRRLVCNESSRGYGEWFCEAITQLGEEPRCGLQRYLLRRGWPDDPAFIPALRDFAIFRRDPSKCRAMLEALEESFGHKEQVDMGKLTIEHVMPQTIQDDTNGRGWKEMLGDTWAAVHEQYLDTLGNLTLTGYNSSLSNKPFDRKRKELAKSHVQLNGYFTPLDAWTAKAIAARGQALAEAVAKIWQRPASTEFPWRAGAGSDMSFGPEPDADIQFSNDEYWKTFVTVLATAGSSLRPAKESLNSRLVFPSERGTSRFEAVLDSDEACIGVRLCFGGKFRASSLRVVEQDRAAIEAEMGQPLDWIYEGKRVQAVAYLDAVRLYDRADWQRQHAWLAATLKRFYQVVYPRIHHPIDDEARRGLLREFWEGFDKYRSGSTSSVDFGAAKPRSWREASLSRWVDLWVNFVVEENWLGVGLQFHDRKGQAIYDEACQQTAALAASLGCPLEQEQEGSYRHLAIYRYVPAGDRSKWPEHYRWLTQAIEQFERFHKDTVVPMSAKRPVEQPV